MNERMNECIQLEIERVYKSTAFADLQVFRGVFLIKYMNYVGQCNICNRDTFYSSIIAFIHPSMRSFCSFDLSLLLLLSFSAIYMFVCPSMLTFPQTLGPPLKHFIIGIFGGKV